VADKELEVAYNECAGEWTMVTEYLYHNGTRAQQVGGLAPARIHTRPASPEHRIGSANIYPNGDVYMRSPQLGDLGIGIARIRQGPRVRPLHIHYGSTHRTRGTCPVKGLRSSVTINLSRGFIFSLLINIGF